MAKINIEKAVNRTKLIYLFAKSWCLCYTTSMIFSIFEYNLSLGEMTILLLGITLIFMLSLSLHEWAHGFVAYKQGDPTPKITGRLTLNPLSHIDAYGFIMFLCIGVGWAKPMPVNPNNFKKYRSGIAKVSIAGVIVNLILCIVGSFLYVLTRNQLGDGDLLVILLELFMWVNAFLVVFNLIPVYPLDGFNFVSSFMRSNNKFVQWNIRNAGKVFLWVIIADLFIELFTGISIIGYLLSTLAGWICNPLCKLWQLMF